MNTFVKPILVLRHTGCVGPGHLQDFSTSHGLTLQLVCLDRGEPLPSDPAAFGAVVVLGGEMNVYDEAEFPFLVPENEFIQQTVNGGIPYLGICLGGQLLAKAMGGRVTRNPVKEFGPYEVFLTLEGRRDSLFAGFPDQFSFCQWHGDTFSELPPGAVLLAGGKTCPHQAFRCGKKAYGLQFHPETTHQLMESWCVDFRNHLASDQQVTELKQQFSGCETTLLRQSERLFENFFLPRPE